MRRLLFVLFIAAVALVATACDTTSEDRGGGRTFIGTSEPDHTTDVDYVLVFRNVNNWPNFAVMCADGFGYVTTRTGGNGSPEIITPDPRWDDFCSDKEFTP